MVIDSVNRSTAGSIAKALMRFLVVLALAALAWLWWKSADSLKSTALKPTTNGTTRTELQPSNTQTRAAEPNLPTLLQPRSLSPTSAVINSTTPALTNAPPVLNLIATSRPLARVMIAANPTPPAIAPPSLTNPPIAPIVAISPATAAVATATLTTTRGDEESRFQMTLSVQLALARLGFSPGSMDGRPGAQTRAALRAFQQREGLSPTGNADSNTVARLVLPAESFTRHVVTAEEVSRIHPVGSTWLAKSEQSRLEFESVLELVAERYASSPKLLQRLNPGLDWNRLTAGSTLVVPAYERPSAPGKATALKIFLSQRSLEVLDENNRVIAHFPCSIAQRVEKRPAGETLRVSVVAPNPNYTFNPEVFPESAEGRTLGRKLILPPGPNNPVGLAWIGLDKAGYGIHGTPKPEDVGRTESHGCFRLANWNAEQLVKMVSVGTPVVVEP